MRFLIIGLICSILLQPRGIAQDILLPQVVAKTLSNGLNVLIVERPGIGAIHARILIKNNANSVAGISQAAIELLTRTAFRRVLPTQIENDFTPLELKNNTHKPLKYKHKTYLKPNSKLQLTLPQNPPLERAIITSLYQDHSINLSNDVEHWDLFDSIGVTRRVLDVTTDFCSYSMDLPANIATQWCQIEANRLKYFPLSRFQIERDQLIKEVENKTYPDSILISTLLNTALPNKPYTIVNNFNKSNIIAINSKILEDYAKLIISPENISLILIGDIKSEIIIPQIEFTFGKLIKKTNSHVCYTNTESNNIDVIDLLETPDGRHLLISTTDKARILFGWRIPPINHQDRLALQTLTKILHDRLNTNIIALRNIGHKVTAQMGIPGQRDINLLVIEAEPNDGHSLSELEQAIQYEIMRIRLELLSEQELYQIQRKIEIEEVYIQEDASKLAKALGDAYCQGGNWRLAFGALTTHEKLTNLDIQKAAQTYLATSKMTIVSLNPNSISIPTNWIEDRIIKVLTIILERKLEDKTKTQTILRETLRQLRMLSPIEQRNTLKLLETKARL